MNRLLLWEAGLAAAGLVYIVLALLECLFSPAFALAYVAVAAGVLIAGRRARGKSFKN